MSHASLEHLIFGGVLFSRIVRESTAFESFMSIGCHLCLNGFCVITHACHLGFDSRHIDCAMHFEPEMLCFARAAFIRSFGQLGLLKLAFSVRAIDGHGHCLSWVFPVSRYSLSIHGHVVFLDRDPLTRKRRGGRECRAGRVFETCRSTLAPCLCGGGVEQS